MRKFSQCVIETSYQKRIHPGESWALESAAAGRGMAFLQPNLPATAAPSKQRTAGDKIQPRKLLIL